MVYTSIKYGVGTGDVAPFVGHNAFLRDGEAHRDQILSFPLQNAATRPMRQLRLPPRRPPRTKNRTCCRP